MQRSGILIARRGNTWSRFANPQLDLEEVSQMSELLEAMEERRPAVLLLAMDFPDLGGPAGIRIIRQRSPSTRIIVLSKTVSDREELEVLRMGARGYCGPVETDVLLKMIEKVQQGEIWAARKTIGALVDEFYGEGGDLPDTDPEVDERLSVLTVREREILRALAGGASNKEIAAELNVTVSTVKAHLTKMFRKLGQADRLHLALYAASVSRASH